LQRAVHNAEIEQAAQACCVGQGARRMSTTLTLMDLAGAIALLIWGVHMV
jgi:hypothetical protein